MPVTIGTLETPYQICQDMYSKLGEIQELLQKHAQAIKPGEKARTDEMIVGSIEILSSEIDKFDDAFFREIYKDAQKIAGLAKKNPALIKNVENILKRLGGLFKLIKRTHQNHKRRAHFLVNFAHKLANLVKKLTRGVEKLEKQHEIMVKKHLAHLPKEVRAKIIKFQRKGLKAA